MLDLIILGLVPGTAIQITFSQVSLVALFMLSSILTFKELKRNREFIQKHFSFKHLKTN